MGLIDEFLQKEAGSANFGGYERYPDHDEIADELGATQIHYDIVDTTRWGHVDEYVYQRGDEFVRVEYETGSGDSEIPYEPNITEVVPVTRTITTYEKKT